MKDYLKAPVILKEGMLMKGGTTLRNLKKNYITEVKTRVPFKPFVSPLYTRHQLYSDLVLTSSKLYRFVNDLE